MTISRPRILVIGMGWPDEQPGGLNTYVRSIVRTLKGSCDVHVLVCGHTLPVEDGVAFAGPVSSKRSLLQRQFDFRKLAAREMSVHAFDLVYVHFAPYAVGPMLEARKRQIPVVFGFHGPWAEEMKVEKQGIVQSVKTATARTMEKRAYRMADHFIVLSEAFAHILHRSYRIPHERIHVIPGGADHRFQVAEDRDQVRDSLGIPKDRLVVLTIRRLVNRMGLIPLVKAWRQVVDRYPDAILYIGGKGPLYEELLQEIAALGLEDHVRLLGYIEDERLPLYYRAADLFVVPSRTLEGFGLITVEALASGIPVAATPIGGSKEIIEKWDARFLFKGIHEGQMAEGLLALLEDRESWPSQQACRSYFEQHYTWEQAGKQIYQLFEQVWRQKEEQACIG
ncbi:glycosyltransferase family 4 protein [Marinicrinis sediminis]|uniref:Glycosyltransferase family 4 protein n=1 Tax=Marinicrinis sediminis TaxID=1652465 RepID=A0ABW5RCC6_9BACL